MQGIFIDGFRPKSKKEIRETVAENPASVHAEATSAFGNEFDGSIADLPEGDGIIFVGPDPYTSRKFYGTITRKGGKFVVA